MKDDTKDIHCVYAHDGMEKIPTDEAHHLFKTEAVNGPELNKKYFDQIYGNFSTNRLFLITVVHVVGLPAAYGGFPPIPIVSDDWIETMFQVANDIWSQACIEIVPFFTGTPITTFRDLRLILLLGFCVEEPELLEPYEISNPDTKIVNVYLVERSLFGGKSYDCGSPVKGRVILNTKNQTAERAGNALAHELGHVMLNPTGISDSENPDHLLYHPGRHPEVSPGSQDGLFMSDCLGARTTAKEDLFVFGRPGGFPVPGEAELCQLRPRLGNNLAIVATTALAPD